MSVPNHRTRRPITQDELNQLASLGRRWRECGSEVAPLFRSAAVARVEEALTVKDKRAIARELGRLIHELERGNRDLSPEGLLAAVAGEAELLSAGRVEAARLVDAGGDRRG